MGTSYFRQEDFAPGLDDVPGLAIKTAALNDLKIFKDTSNVCLNT